MNYNSWGFRGFGGSLSVRNIETNKVYQSHTKFGFMPFIIVEDLPIGQYEIIELEIISGGPIILLRDRNLFNIIELNSPKNYYLGNYLTKKIKPVFKLNIAVSAIENDDDEKIREQLLKKSDKWYDLEIDKEQRLFKSNRTEILIKN